MEGMDMTPSAGAKKAPQPVPAEVRKIDAATGKITLKHGPIANLGMSAMTMAFPVKDPAMLKGLKEETRSRRRSILSTARPPLWTCGNRLAVGGQTV
jgi:Cu/Ag efflux protein CusF